MSAVLKLNNQTDEIISRNPATNEEIEVLVDDEITVDLVDADQFRDVFTRAHRGRKFASSVSELARNFVCDAQKACDEGA